jgi:hypothetical protein
MRLLLMFVVAPIRALIQEIVAYVRALLILLLGFVVTVACFASTFGVVLGYNAWVRNVRYAGQPEEVIISHQWRGDAVSMTLLIITLFLLYLAKQALAELGRGRGRSMNWVVSSSRGDPAKWKHGKPTDRRRS